VFFLFFYFFFFLEVKGKVYSCCLTEVILKHVAERQRIQNFAEQ